MEALACMLKKRFQKVKEMILPKHDRFYPPSWLTQYTPTREELRECTTDNVAKLARELVAASEIFDIEGRDTWVTLLEVVINGIADPIEGRDYEGTVKHLRRFIELSEQEARERWVHEIKTRSGRKIYAKVTKGKIIVWGDTYHVRDALKKFKFQWDPVEKVWYASANVITIDTLKSALEPL
jgi:hypothetical protein